MAGNAFLYSAGTMTDLNTLIPSNTVSYLTQLTVALAINDNGQIVGINYWGHGFLMTPVATASPALNIQLLETNVILTWSNAAFDLQASPSVFGTYTNMPWSGQPLYQRRHLFSNVFQTES